MEQRYRYMLKQTLSFYKNRLRYHFIRLTSTISDNYIVFEAYAGRQYSDSVRAIYEELIQDEEFRSFF